MLEINLKPGAKRRSDRAPVKNPIFRKQLGMFILLVGGFCLGCVGIVMFPKVAASILLLAGGSLVVHLVWMIAGDLVDK